MNEAKTGMWFFLAAEALFFSGFFLTYAVYRYWYGHEFGEAAHHHMQAWIGTGNTAILLTSSYAIAAAVVHGFQNQKRKPALRWVAVTAVLGVIFLLVKFYEYYEKHRQGLLPGFANHRPDLSPTEQLFINLYLAGTGFHFAHMAAGIAALLTLLFFTRKKGTEAMLPTAHRIALYWHFVDIVWIFLYPSFYLLGGGG